VSRGRNRLVVHVVCVVVAAVAALALGACGGGDGDDNAAGSGGSGTAKSDGGGNGQSINTDLPTNDEGVQEATFKFKGSGKSASFVFPRRFVEPDLTQITLVNESTEAVGLQLIRVTGFHVPVETNKALGKVIEGNPFPKWFFLGGGPGRVPPGESKTVTQILTPGAYHVYDSQRGMVPQVALEVRGKKASTELPEADATVTASDYEFETDGLDAGESEIAFLNEGAQPHQLAISELVDDNTAEDAERFFKDEKGKSPLGKETQATTAIEGGEGQLAALDLEPGRYVLYCFISDREGGQPHALEGMVNEVEVE
jgi:hypothetical protein